MRLPGGKLVQRSFRQARSRWLGGVLVLGYHRIGGGDDPFGLAVSVKRFAAQIEILARKTRPVRLSDGMRTVSGGTIPRRTVAVTFDDGYRDTYEEALPVLERTGVFATVFVSTGCPGREFWWDELTRIVMGSNARPDELKIEIGDRLRSWAFGSRPTHPGAAEAAARRTLLTSIANELRPLRPRAREDAMAAIRAWAGQVSGDGSTRARALTIGELKQLAASEYIEIGAHTVSHPVLSLLTRDEQREEVHQSRIDLQSVAGAPVTSFSYPHGAYSAETRKIVAEAGFTIACCSKPDVLRPTSDALSVPRLWVSDQDARSFTGWLDSWLYA
jgi:peptidoglycan/xylan/chitin deacetylase (PgdA/CDA1 family)